MSETTPTQETATQETTTQEPEYAKVELMGHRQRVGRIEDVDRFGAKLLRIHFQDDDGHAMIEDYSGSAIFCVTTLTREVVDAYNERAARRRQEEQDARQRMRDRLSLTAPEYDDEDDGDGRVEGCALDDDPLDCSGVQS